MSTRRLVVRGGLLHAGHDLALAGIGIFLEKVSLGQGIYHSEVGCYEAEGHDESMDPKNLPHLFQPFIKAALPTTWFLGPMIQGPNDSPAMI